MLKSIFIGLLIYTSSAQALIRFVPLPKDKFPEVRQTGCVLFHPWASWCQPCLKELPEYVNWLNAETKVTPVVLDISTPFVQESFSKSFMRTLKPKFPVFLRPDLVDEKDYITSWSLGWQGELPYTELYVKGIRKKTWKGSVKSKVIRREIATLCK